MSSTGWKEYKELAAANNVGYRTFQQRIYSGLSPREAATMQPRQKQINHELSHLKGREVKTEGSMSRVEALEQIDIQMFKYCDTCETRIEMYKRYKNNSSKLEKICINDCPVGKQIQELSKHLTVGPRKKAPVAWE